MIELSKNVVLKQERRTSIKTGNDYDALVCYYHDTELFFTLITKDLKTRLELIEKFNKK